VALGDILKRPDRSVSHDPTGICREFFKHRPVLRLLSQLVEMLDNTLDFGNGFGTDPAAGFLSAAGMALQIPTSS